MKTKLLVSTLSAIALIMIDSQGNPASPAGSSKGGIIIKPDQLIDSSNLLRAKPHRLTRLEASLFEVISKDPAQGRKRMKLDPILCKVARERAKDMAIHDYFSHTDRSGRGPNLKVRRAGFLLPAYYNSTKDANNIESIALTTGGATSVFELWKHSAGHKPHLLGDGFYEDQIAIGVGAYETDDAWGQIYYVFISAPPNGSTNPPRVTLKDPDGKVIARTYGRSKVRGTR